MSDIPPGVTRYPTRFGEASKGPSWKAWCGVAVVMATGVVVPFFNDGSPSTTATLSALGVLVPTMAAFTPWWLRFLLIIGATVALATRADWHSEQGLSYATTYATSLLMGILVMWWIFERRRWLARASAAEGASPSGLNPRGGADVGVLARWSDGQFDYEAVDPSTQITLDAVTALNGDDRTIVSIYRGRARMDIGGDAAGNLVVQQADDRRRWRTGFQVADPAWRSPPPAEDLPNISTAWITYAGERLEYPTPLLTTLAAAHAAVHAWLSEGTRDASLRWWSPPDRRSQLRRPAVLQEHDRPGSTSGGAGDTSYMLD